jgi:hypothetical protein
MASAGRAACADSFFESEMARSRRGGIPIPMSPKDLDLAALCDNSRTARLWIVSQTSVAFHVMRAGTWASCRSLLRRVRPGANGLGLLPALAPKILTLSAMAYAMAVAGCAQNSAQREVAADPIHAAAPSQGHSEERSEPRIRRPDRALLAPQRAPDCEFAVSDLKTVDPDQWVRLKLDYERQCYQHAEKIVRDRLRLLQASNRCEAEPVRHSLTTIR